MTSTGADRMYYFDNYWHWQNVLVWQVLALTDCITVTSTGTDRMY